MNLVDISFNLNKLDSDEIWIKIVEMIDEDILKNNKIFLLNNLFHEYLKTNYSQLHSLIVDDVSLKYKNMYENQYFKIIDKISLKIYQLENTKRIYIIDLLLKNIFYKENNHSYLIDKTISSFILCSLIKKGFNQLDNRLLSSIIKNNTDQLLLELFLNTFMNRDFISFHYKLLSIAQLDVYKIFYFYIENNLHIKYFNEESFNIFIHIEQLFLKFHHHIFQIYPAYRSSMIIQKQIKDIYMKFEFYFKYLSKDELFYEKFCYIDKNIFYFNKKYHLSIHQSIKEQLFPSILNFKKIKKLYSKSNPQKHDYIFFNANNPVIKHLVQENISYFCSKKSLAVDMNLICYWYGIKNKYQEYDKSTFFNILVKCLFELEKSESGWGSFDHIKIGDWSLLDNTKYSPIEFAELYSTEENFNKIRQYIFFIIEAFFMKNEEITSHLDILNIINSSISHQHILNDMKTTHHKKKFVKI